MNTEQNILKDRLIQLLEMFNGKSGNRQGKNVEKLADQLLQILYDGKGNDFGIIQIDAVKGLEPFMFSLIDDLKSDEFDPAKLSVDRFRRIQELLIEFNVKPSKDQDELFNSIESMENMLESEEVDVNQFSTILNSLNKQLSDFPDKEASRKVFQSIVSKVGGKSEMDDNIDFKEFVGEFTSRLKPNEEKINLEEVAIFLRSKYPSLFGPSEADLKRKYDNAAQAAIKNALKENGFD